MCDENILEIIEKYLSESNHMRYYNLKKQDIWKDAKEQ